MSAKLSIIVPHYGDPQLAERLITELASQLDARHELIVVDDASPSPFPTTTATTVVRRERNGGFGAAVNAGAAVSSGDYLLILNSDLNVPNDLVSQLLRSTELFPAAVLAPRIQDSSDETVISARAWPTLPSQVLEWLTPLARFRNTGWLQHALGHNYRVRAATKPTPVDWLLGAALLIPRDAFESVGGFDERFFMTSEEVDLQRRLAELGLPRIYYPDTYVTHLGGGSSPTAQRRRWLVAGQLRYAEKWGNRVALRLALTLATLLNFGWNMLRNLAGREVAPRPVAREELTLIWQRA